MCFSIFIITSVFFIYLKIDLQYLTGLTYFSMLEYSKNTIKSKGYLIDTIGCKIPDFHHFDESILEYVTKKYIVECPKKYYLVNIINRTKLQINRRVLQKHYKNNIKHCSYTPVYRDETTHSDSKYKWNTSIIFYRSLQVTQEFGKIECFNKALKKVYEDFYAFILKKEEVENRCKKNWQRHQREHPNKDYLSVLIVAIDSVSRLNFLRHCPKTHDYLQNTMKAIVLKGYNKVADNTFVNMVPLLTGKYSEELPWDQTMLNLPFDNYTFAWDSFSKIGYRTLFAEDAPKIATFNYNKVGFHHQPTDYYFRPFALALEDSDLRAKSVYHCVGSKLEASMMLDYATDFAETFKKDLYFGFTFVGRLTHDDLSIVSTVEKPALKFLKYLHTNDLLNNTMLIFMSDHGIRFGDLRKTYIGMLEERLPFYYLVFPKWFHNKYPDIIKALRINEKRLTTPFDIFGTLSHLLNFDGKSVMGNTSVRSLSLFNEIPSERTCEDASIETHWCTCQVHQPVSILDPIVYKAAGLMLQSINEHTETYRNICHSLTLNKIKNALVSVHKKKFLEFGDTWDLNYKGERIVKYGKAAPSILNYLLIIETSPNNGVFEGTVKYIEITKQLNLAGDVSRIDEYGNQSSCITVNYLKKFCYCYLQ